MTNYGYSNKFISINYFKKVNQKHIVTKNLFLSEEVFLWLKAN